MAAVTICSEFSPFHWMSVFHVYYIYLRNQLYFIHCLPSRNLAQNLHILSNWVKLILKQMIIVVLSVQSLSRVWFFVILWTAAWQAFLSITNSQSQPKLKSIESVMPYNHLILCRPLLLPPSIFPSIRSFPMNQFFTSGGQSFGISASASDLPMNIQDWFPLGWTGWISFQSKGLSRVFYNTTVHLLSQDMLP